MLAEKILKRFNKIESEPLYEMSNYWPKDTNLPYKIWVSVGEVNGKKLKHGPRIKVSIDGSSKFDISISISNKPELKKGDLDAKEFSKFKEWILLNKDLLLRYWNMEISEVDFVKGMKKIG